jgi:hypothetical protein
MRRLLVTVQKWIRDAGASVAKLAEYIAAADGQGLQDEPYSHGIAQMLGSAKKRSCGAAATAWASGSGERCDSKLRLEGSHFHEEPSLLFVISYRTKPTAIMARAPIAAPANA